MPQLLLLLAIAFADCIHGQKSYRQALDIRHLIQWSSSCLSAAHLVHCQTMITLIQSFHLSWIQLQFQSSSARLSVLLAPRIHHLQRITIPSLGLVSLLWKWFQRSLDCLVTYLVLIRKAACGSASVGRLVLRLIISLSRPAEFLVRQVVVLVLVSSTLAFFLELPCSLHLFLLLLGILTCLCWWISFHYWIIFNG